MELDTMKYLALNAHASGVLAYEYRFMKSFNYNTPAPVYDPITYNLRITHANVFYKNMLLRRQRVLFLSSIDDDLKVKGPFSHLFLTSICDRWRT